MMYREVFEKDHAVRLTSVAMAAMAMRASATADDHEALGAWRALRVFQRDMGLVLRPFHETAGLAAFDVDLLD